MASYPFLIVDVFTDIPLAGNQLAVFLEGDAVPEALLQPLALEMGFAETVFVYEPLASETARIRIFTPRQELTFAGHPVLGTAVALGVERDLDSVVLQTGRGNVPLTVSHDGRRGFGTMQQPVPTVSPFDDEEDVLTALGLAASTLPVEIYDNGMRHVYFVVSDVSEVVALRPDLASLERLGGRTGINCAAGSGETWTTRMFAPGEGIPEDAATGSAAGPLACHLARHGLIEFGQTITISQGAQIGRPSTLFATARGERDEIKTVEVSGNAVVVATGRFQF